MDLTNLHTQIDMSVAICVSCHSLRTVAFFVMVWFGSVCKHFVFVCLLLLRCLPFCPIGHIFRTKINEESLHLELFMLPHNLGHCPISLSVVDDVPAFIG